MSARRISDFSIEDFPADGSPLQRLEFALRYAELAPTTIKLRSWEPRLGDGYLELMAHDNSALEAMDEDGRESMIGCGAALQYLKTALKHFRCLGRVAIFPNLDEPRLVARIHLGLCGERDVQDRVFFQAMASGGLNRTHTGGRIASESAFNSIRQAAEGERSWLEFIQSDTSRQRVMETLVSDQRLTGLINAVGLVHNTSVPAMPLAVVKTKTDDKHGWLAAGQTMGRVVLQAEAMGLSWDFFDHVSRPRARKALRTAIGHKGFAQVILRFGSLTPAEPAQRQMQSAAAVSASI